ncbi:MAG TPA: DUF4446 family protein [Candidatus Limnocylindrales bacterium]
MVDSRADGGRTLVIDVASIAADPLAPAVGGLAIVVAVLVLALLALTIRLRRLSRRLDRLTAGESGRSLEAVIEAQLATVARASRQVEELGSRSTTLEATTRRSLQRIGLVRYNPFEDTGGNQSFALALLDAEGNGFVVSSLHARAVTRVYAKAVTAGQGDGALSNEEADAVRRALARPAETRT